MEYSSKSKIHKFIKRPPLKRIKFITYTLLASLLFFSGALTEYVFSSINSASHDSNKLSNNIVQETKPIGTYAHIPQMPKFEANTGCCEDSRLAECVACAMKLNIKKVCMKFSQLGGCDNYQVLSNYAVLNTEKFISGSLGRELDQVTVSLWIKLSDLSSDDAPKLFSVSSEGKTLILFVTQNGGLQLSLASSSVKSISKQITHSEWMFIGVTADLTSGDLALYINGERTSTSNSAPLAANLLNGFEIGPFNGKISSFRVYKGILPTLLTWDYTNKPELEDQPKILGLQDRNVVSLKFDGTHQRGNWLLDENSFEEVAEFSGSGKRNNEGHNLRGGLDQPVITPDSEPEPEREPIPLESNRFQSFQEFEDFILQSVTKSELVEGSYKDVSDRAILAYSNKYGEHYKELPRNAMKFAYSNYEKNAFGHDELKPRSGGYNDKWGGHGVTLVDSLDTLWIMGMKDEFFRARDWVRDHLSFNTNKYVSFFETTIRDLGGLLSAYYLSEDRVFLDKASDLGSRLFSNFENGKIPVGQVNLATRQTTSSGWLRHKTLLAEVGTCQLEFAALGHLTGESKYIDKPRDIMEKLETEGDKWDGLLPTFINIDTGKAAQKSITFGAMGDSFYEYLLKIWIQSNFQEHRFRTWYDESMQGLSDHIIQRTHPTGLSYLADVTAPNWSLNKKMDHLACFAAGMLGLGAHHSDKSINGEKNRDRDMIMAKKLMYTCVEMYLRQPTGLSPEWIKINDNVDFRPGGNTYILRPEVVESLFILHQLTQHPIYRIWGKKIMEKIEEHCRSKYGYGHYTDVTRISGPDDSMESFFLAETLKYHFLLQEPEKIIDLNKWVFNTEAHPLKIFE